MDIVFGILIGIVIAAVLTAPLWISGIIERRRANTVNIGNIYIEYNDTRDPFRRVYTIFKVIDKKDGYIQYEEFRSTDDAISDIPWYDDGERRISSKSLYIMTSTSSWRRYECWYTASKK